MTAPVRVLVFGDTSTAARVEATLRPPAWRCVIAALPGRADAAPALEIGTGDIAVLCHDARPSVETCRQLAQWLNAAGTDVPLMVVLRDGDAGCAADLMRAGARDCVTDSQLSRLVPAIERELEAAAVRHERRTLDMRLQHAQRMEAVGRLASGVAHDFSNLLTAVTGYSDVLIEMLAPHDPLRQTAEEIRGAALRASALTGQLLTLSRPQPSGAILDVNVLVTDMEQMLRRSIGEHIELVVTLARKAASVTADRGRMEQVIMNLVFNARDAMPGGGRLWLATAHVDVGAGDGEHAAGVAPGAYVALEVRDTGHGMDEATQAHLFEPFFTTKPSTKGSGLGLSLVQAVVRDLGGMLTVRSQIGEGSTFRILLPRAAAAVATSPRARRSLRSLPRGNETVLLVDDEVGVRELVRDLLKRCGYTVIEASDVNDALALFTRHRDAIQLLVTDIVMPQMNGRQLAQQFMAERPGLKVLYMSGYTDDQVLVQDAAAVPSFLQKPFTPDVLARTVRAVLDAAPPA
jgi:two-component system, cell cycle sensor histidine kinase and response regulator CckA